MIEKYIYTPEEAEIWRERDAMIREKKKLTPEKREKKEFVDSLNAGHYLPSKEFKEMFKKRKEEKELEEKRRSNDFSRAGEED